MFLSSTLSSCSPEMPARNRSAARSVRSCAALYTHEALWETQRSLAVKTRSVQPEALLRSRKSKARTLRRRADERAKWWNARLVESCCKIDGGSDRDRVEELPTRHGHGRGFGRFGRSWTGSSNKTCVWVMLCLSLESSVQLEGYT